MSRSSFIRDESHGSDRALRLLLGAILFLVACGIYANTLGGEFIKDDIYQVLRNEWIRDPSNIGKVFFSSAWGFMAEGGEQGYYRPWMHIFYMVSYALSELRSWGYHAVNIVLHAVNTLLVFTLALRLFAEYAGFKRIGDKGLLLTGAFLAALLFTTHPINTEAVAWVAAVPELSFTLFCLISFLLYTKERYIFSALFFFAALFAKETAISLPVILVAFDLAVRRERVRPLLGWIKRYWPYMLGVVVYLAFKMNAVGLAEVGVEGANLSGAGVALNIPPLIVGYLAKLLIPTKLVYFHHLRFELIGSIFELRGVFYIALSIVFMLFMLWSFRTLSLIFFFFVWMLAPLLPVVALSFAGGMPTFSERYLYFSSPGFALLIVYILMRFAAGAREERTRKKAALAMGLFFLIVATVFSVATIKRNTVWHTSLGLWADVIEKAPDNMTARLWYGNELVKSERLDEAIRTYREAITFNPNDDLVDGIRNNLGIVYALQGKLDLAIGEFRAALMKDPENVEAKKNLDNAMRLLGGG